ncbi:unnamed protein product [Phytophthora lilii]|uniref:Unnamed protein product n=1 Tax=Phytophthora lilii TaxID=2077276 RepID=A0A9W7DC25_9STRA|nr:unnamed protein product [Phytophthora lilii]
MEKDHDQAQSASWGEYNSPRLPDPESQWAECISDNGEVYYHNVVTGETSWTKPGAELEHHESSEWAGEGTEGHMIDEGNAVSWEGLETPGEAEAGEATQWLELYDPVQQMTYYFSPQSGEVRWEPPSEDLNAIRHCDSDAVLSTVVSLQSAARSQQARTRVASIRQQKTIEHQLEDNHTDDVKFAAEGIGEEDAVNEVGVDHTDEQETSHNLDSQWIEVYDPVAQQQYYYSPRTNETRWNTPEILTTPSDDRKVAAAISIQSLSRGLRARKEVNELRTHTPHHGNQQELDREAMHRREMNHQELLQLKGGDRFWGVDVYEHEMMQQCLEEELSARTKSLNTQIAATRPPQPDAFVLNIQPLEYPEYEYFEEEVDQEQLQRDAQDEFNARLAMSHEEAQQCQNGDSFWGIQAEVARQNNSNIAMAQEEAASRRFADSVIELALSATWEAEVQQSATKELAARGGQEQRMQDRYLRWFYRQCVSVDELLDYRWPTKQQQERLEEVSSQSKRRRQNVTRPFQDVVESATPFPLDDLIVRERLEHGDLRYGLRSVVTVHHQSVHGTNGTHYQITKASPECAFNEVTAAALLKTEMLAYSSDPQTEDRCSDLQDDRAAVNNLDGELIPGSSVNYRCSDVSTCWQVIEA